MHGQSLVPAFTHDGSVKHAYLWWNHEGNRAIRIGDWKLVADHKSPWELYDLSKDRSETHNIAAAHPDRVKEMEQAWTKRAVEFHALAQQDPPRVTTGKQKAPASKDKSR